jgi:hypothetical protein
VGATVVNGEGNEVVYAAVCLKSGIVLDNLGNPTPTAQVAGWAAAAPELFRADQKAKWTALFARLGGESGSERFREFILVSADHVHVLERIEQSEEMALVVVGPAKANLGVLLSQARQRLIELEAG